MFRNTAGLSHRYDLGGDQPLVGRTAPDFRFDDGTRLGDLLHQGQGIALDFTTGRNLQDAAERWKDRIRYAPGPVGNDLGCGAALIRPDGVIAWAEGYDTDTDGFQHAATRWFGAPLR
ncbi:hypothetical protein [Streptomyces sp. NPDC096323]|uniref:aromatic-ring hydroxylase C-terminal domain-containing protein n=1 Tax=Streptomyces sp. NPDC096323 TaxID=3155822 RepID=UPI00331DBE91